MADRPDWRPSWPEVPEGHEVVAIIDPDWRVVERPKRCRRQPSQQQKACGKDAVAEVNRGGRMRANRRGATRDSWWAYCPEHMYGRWVEEGFVMHWILVKVGQDA